MGAVKRVKVWTDFELAQLEDGELVAECLAGNTSAWEALIVRYQRLIYSIPARAKLSADDSSDIFQSVCLKLYEKLPTLRDHEKLYSWLITTTRRECWRLSARNKRETTSDHEGQDGASLAAEIIDGSALADEQQEMLEQQQMLREAIAQLPERSRMLINLLFYEMDELSYAEIARRMNMPVASIGPTRSRCLEKLRKIMEEKSRPRRADKPAQKRASAGRGLRLVAHD